MDFYILYSYLAVVFPMDLLASARPTSLAGPDMRLPRPVGCYLTFHIQQIETRSPVGA